MVVTQTGPLLFLLLLLLLDVLVAAQHTQHRGNNLRNQAPGFVEGAEFDVFSHLEDIALHGGFFFPVVEASQGVSTLSQPRQAAVEKGKTKSTSTAKRFISGAAMCGSYTLVRGEAVALATPNFPENYTANFDCIWAIKATLYIDEDRRKSGQVWTPRVTVHLGVVTREQGGQVVVEASTVILHQKLNFHYDVALLKLERPVEFSDTIRPICLPPRSLSVSPEGARVEIAGWGNDESGTKSNVLKVLKRLGMSWETCKAWFPKYITQHHFCTHGRDRRHICVGDSGGPVMVEVEGRLALLGVTSFTATASCNGTKPDGHISVPHFLDWIEQETGIKLPV
ncbi:Collagenase [Portunus trituberculatus]|uniref:Collagenase n=1 Tax=Portunus trituberculatus TaxID=210409 RepID=A0A5B7DUR6_PORTR|nr:Collagenase [Portunus trituberculatus]